MKLFKPIFLIMLFFSATSINAEDIKKFKAGDGTDFDLLLQTVIVESETVTFTMRIENPETYKVKKYKYFNFFAWCDENVLRLESTSFGDCFNCSRSAHFNYSLYDSTSLINLNQDRMARDAFSTVCQLKDGK